MHLHQTSPGRGYDREAYELAERGRARTLLELLHEAKLDVKIAPELLEQRRKATGRLTWLQLELPKVLAMAEQDKRRITGLRKELEEVKLEIEQIETTIRSQYYAELKYPKPRGVTDVQALLDDESALLQYLLGDEVSYLFVITRSGFWVEPLGPAGQILDLVTRVRDGLEERRLRLFARYTRSSRELYDLLVAPVEEHIAGIRTLIIAPDRDLYYLPFEALVVGQTRSSSRSRASYLLERWNVIYVPSATVFAALSRDPDGGEKRKNPCSKTFVALADPTGVWQRPDLPGSRREVTRIAGLFDSKQVNLLLGSEAAELFDSKHVRLLLGSEATELASKEDECISGARWLHIACHGKVDEDRPAYSALLLAKDKQGREDGQLQVHEVFGLRLQAEMVALSACETGLGKEIRGEGLVGLTQAFFYAGARSLIVSLWQVSDRSTEKLMVQLYQALKNGSHKSEALRQAKLALLHDEVFAHPYYWSPFILVGAR
jgi:CHAT domain-containing protein